MTVLVRNNPLATIGRVFLLFLAAIGRLVLFTGHILSEGFRGPYYFRQFGRMIIEIGYFSLPVIGLTTLFTGAALAHVAEQEFFGRHPETQLQNVLRMELFVSNEASATCWLELLDREGRVATTHIATNGSVLLLNSDHYHLRCQANTAEGAPAAKWHSLIAYYYINDRARVASDAEPARSGY